MQNILKDAILHLLPTFFSGYAQQRKVKTRQNRVNKDELNIHLL